LRERKVVPLYGNFALAQSFPNMRQLCVNAKFMILPIASVRISRSLGHVIRMRRAVAILTVAYRLTITVTVVR